ncbi:MAG: potassium-transporting ATPase subunit F [Thermoleophilaceae bacterium]|nr:potassium-transporting ATPase subunit F [Thermoleophilaceae bacterium]
MSTVDALGLAVALLVFLFLFYALLRGEERF